MTTDPRSTSPPPWLLAVLVVVLLALPYTTLTLSFRASLYVQTTGLLAVLALAGLAGVSARRRLRLSTLTPLTRRGLGLWLGAAALGAVVGLLQANSPRFFAGQLLSMVFLPLAAVVGAQLTGPAAPVIFARGLVYGGSLIAAGHLVHWAVSLLRGQLVRRLFLDNAIALGTLSLLCVLFAVSLALADHPTEGRHSRAPAARRALPLAASLILGVYLFGTGIRGLWLLVLPCLGASLFLTFRGRWQRPSRTLLAAFAVALLGLLAAAGTHRWLAAPRPNLVPEPGASRTHSWSGELPTRQLLPPFPIRGRGTYRFSALVSGGEHGLGQVSVRWLDEWGERLGGMSVWADPAGDPRWLTIIDTAPRGTQLAELIVLGREDARGTWRLEGARLEALRSPLPALLVTQAAYFDQRLTAIAALFSREGTPGDNSLSIRRAENRALVARFAAAPLARKLFGHGLGATFSAGPGAAASLAEGAAGEQSYIHNFFLFLLFKLGLLGSLACMAALACWITEAVRASWREDELPRRALLAAAASAWIAYGVLGLSSPELINFRFAPIFGLLLAASSAAITESRKSTPTTPG